VTLYELLVNLGISLIIITSHRVTLYEVLVNLGIALIIITTHRVTLYELLVTPINIIDNNILFYYSDSNINLNILCVITFLLLIFNASLQLKEKLTMFLYD